MSRITLSAQSYGPLTPPRSPVLKTMSSLPSIGDVLQLSQSAWRTGRAFNSGRRSGTQALPESFHDIEDELNRLAKALKRLAEFLVHENIESLVSGADHTSRDSLSTILTSCKRTLDDLESLTDTYQTTRKSTTSRGYAIERVWNQAFLTNHHALVWTVNGGSIYDLFEMLRMHTVTMTMLKSVLETHSTAGFEMGIIPVAEKINELYQTRQEDLSASLAEIRGLAQAYGGDLPSPSSTVPPTPNMPGFNILRRGSLILPPAMITPEMTGTESNASTPTPVAAPERTLSSYFPTTPAEKVRLHPDVTGLTLPRRIDPPDSEATSPLTVIPPSHIPPTPNSEQLQGLKRSATTAGTPLELPGSTPAADESDRPKSTESFHLPPPAWDEASKSINRTEKLVVIPQIFEQGKALAGLVRSSSTISQQHAFERHLFRNAAILCDLRGTMVEYTVPAKDDEPFEVELEQAMTNCRICLVRHKRMTSDGRITYTTSIWSFNDERTVRLEQRLDDREEIIPYTSYFQPEKASITIPTKLIYHDISRGSEPVKLTETTWLNYYFDDEANCRQFQNELYGRSLMASFKTEKTIRVHEGLAGIVASQEQMCAMENLRVWDEDETGGVLALIHFSALFRQGYMRFYVNNARWPITVKDEGGRILRIKGLRIPGEQKGSHHHHHHHHRGHRGSGPWRNNSIPNGAMKTISAKVEFSNEADKHEFIELVRDAQKGMVDVEDV